MKNVYIYVRENIISDFITISRAAVYVSLKYLYDKKLLIYLQMHVNG
jgi:hypothetical protein